MSGSTEVGGRRGSPATVGEVAEPSERDSEIDAADPMPDDALGDDPAGDQVDDADVRDELPDDLNAGGFVGPYVFPNNNRRRVPGYLYLGIAAVCLVVWLVGHDGGVLVNGGFLAAAIAMAAIGAFHLVAGWNLDVDERDALVAATVQVAFPVGHASAQLGWRGLRSKPTWRILVYSAENPPTRRGLVLVDGVDGKVVSWFTEDNPEDWSDLDGALGRDAPASSN